MNEKTEAERMDDAPAQAPTQDARSDDEPTVRRDDPRDAQADASEAMGNMREQLAQANARIASLVAELDAHNVSRRLHEALEDAGAVRIRDAHRAARQLAAGDVSVGEAVERVRAEHPEFFAASRWPSTNAPATEASSGDAAGALAARARMTNDRRALLEYLRARRA